MMVKIRYWFSFFPKLSNRDVFPNKLNQNWNWIGFVLLLDAITFYGKRFFRFSFFDSKNWSSFISFSSSFLHRFYFYLLKHFSIKEKTGHRIDRKLFGFFSFNWSLKFGKVVWFALEKLYWKKILIMKFVHLHFKKENLFFRETTATQQLKPETFCHKLCLVAFKFFNNIFFTTKRKLYRTVFCCSLKGWKFLNELPVSYLFLLSSTLLPFPFYLKKCYFCA